MPFLDGDKIGYIDYHTNLVYIPPMFHEGRLFHEGLAAVRMNKSSKWVFIDENGAQVISKDFVSCTDFNDGLAVISRYDDAATPIDIMGAIRRECVSGVINASGEEVIPCEYSSIKRRADGFFDAKKGKKEYLFDGNGNLVFESDLYTVHGLIEPEIGLFKVRQNDTHLSGLLDLCGNFVLSPKYDEMESFSEGLCPVCSYVSGHKKWGFINTDGVECIPCQFQEVGGFHNGVAIFSELHKEIKEFVLPDGKIVQPYAGHKAEGLINTSGEIVIEPMTYYDLFGSSEGLLEYRDFKTFLAGFLNPKGEVAIPCQFEMASRFKNGLCVVQNPDGKCGFIDRQGKTILPFVYDFDQSYFDYSKHFRTEDDLFVLKKNGKYGVADTACRTIIPHRYDRVSITRNELFLVQQGEKVGLVDHHGCFIIPMGKYVKIDEVPNSLGLNLFMVYVDSEKSGILDSSDQNGVFRVPCLFYHIDRDGIAGWINHTCMLSVCRFDENHKALRGKADLFGNYLIKEN